MVSTPSNKAYHWGIWLALLTGAPVVASRAKADAAEDFQRAARNLATSADFRVRAQAALALGASHSPRAIDPLCKAVDDSSEGVRAAVAAAVGRLKLGGRRCLEKRLQVETEATVRTTIRKALALLAPEPEPEPVISSDTRFYLAIGKTTDKTGRSDDEADKIVRTGMLQAANDLRGFVVAPLSETPAMAKKRLTGKRGVKALFMSPRLAAPDYSGGALTMRIDVALFTYPDRDWIANFTVRLTQEGVTTRSAENENELIQMVAERAMQKLEKAASQIR